MSAPSTCISHQGCSHLWSTLPVLDEFPKCCPHPYKYFLSLLLSLNMPSVFCQDLDWCMVYILTLSSPDFSFLNIRHLYPTASSPSLLYPKLNSVFHFQNWTLYFISKPILPAAFAFRLMTTLAFQLLRRNTLSHPWLLYFPTAPHLIH